MWIDHLEQKFGRYAISHLMRYVCIGSAVVYLLTLVLPAVPYFLNMVPQYVLKGQVWRLLTFVLVPSMSNPLLTLLSLFCYYWIGEALEGTWGAFRFNLFFFIGMLAVDIVIFILYAMGYDFSQTVHQCGYLFQSMFLALATLYPDMQFLVMYIIPLKAKWAGLISAALLVFELVMGSIPVKLLIIGSMAGYLIFFLPDLIGMIKAKIRKENYQRKTTYRGGSSRGSGYGRGAGYGSGYGNSGGYSGYGSAGNRAFREQNSQNVREDDGTQVYTQEGRRVRKQSAGKVVGVAFHRCTVCGITELDDPDMTFRYCSQCNGNYEYCENHIYNHTHIT